MNLAFPSSIFQLHDERVIACRKDSNLHLEFYQPCHSACNKGDVKGFWTKSKGKGINGTAAVTVWPAAAGEHGPLERLSREVVGLGRACSPASEWSSIPPRSVSFTSAATVWQLLGVRRRVLWCSVPESGSVHESFWDSCRGGG